MSKLLGTDCFDSFLLEKAVISTQNTYTIDGSLNRSFYTKEELEDPALCPYPFSCWKTMRAVCFDLIKGKRPPVFFQFVLHLKPEPAAKMAAGLSLDPATLKALVLTIRYENGHVLLITGTSFTTFVPDKSLDALWDKTIKQFLQKKEIGYEEM